MTNEDGIVVARKCSDITKPMENSTREKCSECGDLVWVTPATLQLSKRKGYRIVCVKCLVKIAPDGETAVEPLTDDQKREIEDYA